MFHRSSAARSKDYFDAELSKGDYYLDGQEMPGRWGGKAAHALGLEGSVERQAFHALCDNLNPQSGERLTQRTMQNRRIGYDINFHAPKSLSILYAATGDKQILDAFRSAVSDSMEQMEGEMKARVRKGAMHGTQAPRVTGNMVWGEFVHFTARPVEGIPDPHLHAHCFAFNATYDGAEGEWKAGEFGNLKRDGSYFEAAFHSRLAQRIGELGYGIERHGKVWEVAGIPKAAIDRFSRRTAVIEQAAQDKGITDAKAKDKLGAVTREAKAKGMPMGDLMALWRARMEPAEREAVADVAAHKGVGRSPAITAGQAVDYALAKSFERASVVPEKGLMAEALRRGVGQVTVEAVAAEIGREGIITREVGGQRLSTTRAVLAEEKAMLAFAREGRGVCRPLGSREFEFQPVAGKDGQCFELNADQKAAVRHVLGSRDRVTAIRGVAGVGKTTLMHEAVRGLREAGREVFTFAPSAEASRGVLRREGFGEADTVARLLQDPKLQERAQGQVLWVDEASLLDTRTMGDLFALAERQDCRVVLSGDVRQHAAVARGDALRLLERKAGIDAAEVREIVRQRGGYKEAIAALAKGDVLGGFDRLDGLGYVVEVEEEERTARLVEDYTDALRQGKSALVVSPTHAEGERTSDAIRERLRADGRIGPEDRCVARLRSLNWTESERADAGAYREGLVLEFHQNAKGFKRGERVEVVGKGVSALLVERAGGERKALATDQAGKFEVYERTTLAIAERDRIRVTRNGKTVDGKHRLNNGALYDVKQITPEGTLVLGNGWEVGRDFGHLAHGYCTTSHASQGKTVDRVLVAQSALSFPASSREQFYVSASRGKEGVTIYTDDKKALSQAIQRSGERMGATELVGDGREDRRRDHLFQHAGLLRRLGSYARSLGEKGKDIFDKYASMLNMNERGQQGAGHER